MVFMMDSRWFFSKCGVGWILFIIDGRRTPRCLRRGGCCNRRLGCAVAALVVFDGHFARDSSSSLGGMDNISGLESVNQFGSREGMHHTSRNRLLFRAVAHC